MPDVRHLDVGLDAELLEGLLGLHPEEQAGAEAHAANRQDLHVRPSDLSLCVRHRVVDLPHAVLEGADQSQHVAGLAAAEQRPSGSLVRQELGEGGQRGDVALVVGRGEADDETDGVVRAVAERRPASRG